MLYNKAQPFLSRIKERSLLNKQGSSKQTYHIVLDIADSGIQFDVGDSIAVLPQNDPVIVKDFLSALQANGEEKICDRRSGETLSLQHFLSHKTNLARVNSSLLEQICTRCPDEELSDLLQKENRSQLSEYLKQQDLLELLKKYQDIGISLDSFCASVSPLLPRFYSIASSQNTHPSEIHLTVALFTFTEQGEKKFGVASHFLCNVAEKDNHPIPIYIQKSHGFTLPSDDSLPIIMIGPGTGIAPFRAFLQERMHRNAQGKNWLFFGERNKSFDFFYEDFWQGLEQKNILQFTPAFSRDQDKKVYVQHKMYEEKKQIWSWIQEGAVIYVCGDASRMAKDVEATLQTIIKEESGCSEEDSRLFIKNLRSQKRYLLDVY